MKTANVLRFITFLCFFAILFATSSCKKIVDLLIKDPHATVDGCRIEKIVHWDGEGSDPRTYVFKYNSKGYPISAISDLPATGAPNFFFRYDSKNRLTDYIELYGNNNYQNWVKYTYDHSGRVIRDTTWTFGVYGDTPDPDSYYIFVRHYSYDAYGRVSQVNSEELQPIAGSLYSIVYNYDASGNLLGWGPYDTDHINMNRTHKIWMFLNRDYSLNPAPPALTYNANNLPTRFWGNGNFIFLGLNMEYSEIQYSCK